MQISSRYVLELVSQLFLTFVLGQGRLLSSPLPFGRHSEHQGSSFSPHLRRAGTWSSGERACHEVVVIFYRVCTLHTSLAHLLSPTQQ